MDEYDAIQAWLDVVGAARLEPMEKVTNMLWRVVAEDGRTWVLKQLPEYAPGVGPVEAYRVLCYLQSCGLPVALPVITDEGLIVHNADNLRRHSTEKRPTGTQAYALLPLLPDDPGLSESPDLARTIGAGIGRLDRALAACPWQVTSFTDDPARQILVERFPQLPEELRALIAPHWEALHAAIVDLPMQRTHGDCNVGNLLVHDGAVSGYLDLDHLPIGPRVRDLSYYLASRLVMQVADGEPEAMAGVLGHYIAGYHLEHPLAERELVAVVPMMATVEVGRADWSLNGWVPDPAAYQQSLRTINWLTQHYADLVSAAALGNG